MKNSPFFKQADLVVQLIPFVNAETCFALKGAEREFLLSMKRLEPKWELLGIPGLERLPGLQWKLHNLRKMEPAKRLAAKNSFDANFDYEVKDEMVAASGAAPDTMSL